MDVTLQKHEAKHIYKVPEGLRELCTDISREPTNLYDFIAEYVDTLLITRENTKIAVKVVNNILLGSQAILSVLYRTGFSLEQITVAAPRIQKAFREYLDAVDLEPTPICEDHTCDERSMASIRSILEATGSTREDAIRAATVIQSAFRGHYERMALNEAQGKIQWQRAVTNTLDILRKAGATQTEISKAAKHVKFAYRGYYTRRNQKMGVPEADYEPDKKDERILEPAEAIQAVAWMEMMFEDSGLTLERANEAASVIQRAYRKYRKRRGFYDVQRLESTKSMVVEAILSTLRYKVFEKVTSRDDIPKEYGTRADMVASSTKLRIAFKEHLQMSRITKEGHLEHGGDDEEESLQLDEGSEEEEEETLATERSPTSDYPPQETEAKSEVEYTEEQLTEAETDEQPASETEVTEVRSEAEAEYPMESEHEDEAEEQGTKETEEREHETAEVEEAEVEEAEVKEAEVKETEVEEAEVKEEVVEEAEVKEADVEEADVEEAEVKEAEVEEEPNVAQETATAGDAAE